MELGPIKRRGLSYVLEMDGYPKPKVPKCSPLSNEVFGTDSPY